ncbi:MarR family winged helix-turn-helix transcriptional regulator [Allokutzneria oryzae]|uniref:MarR family winged helix-turn-helix transcriptional regulator n=1 Tax=Allokutzneria oryzae TaxID=1378989 RepID=A0ABV6A6F5_9PSEU
MDEHGDLALPGPGADVASWPTGRLLSVAARMVEHRWHAYLEQHNLTHAGLIALHGLEREPLTQRQLATACRVTDQTMSRTTERLERAGYVRREQDSRDRRRTTVTITDAGRQVLAQAREAERESEALLGSLGDYENFRRELVHLIELVGPSTDR